MTRLDRRTIGIGAAALAAALAAAPARAQDTIPVTVPTDTVIHTVDVGVDSTGVLERRFAASPLLPEEHWAARAAWRAEAMGLAPGYLPAQRAVPRAAVAAALRTAVSRADGPFERVALGWWERFVEEFPEYGDERRSLGAVTVLGSQAAAGYREDTGRLAPAVGYADTRQLPAALADASGARAGAWLAAAAGPLSASLEPRLRDGDVGLRRWDAAVGVGAFQLSVGRESVGYGYARSGGIVYSASEPLTRVEVQTTRPIRLPSILRHVGGVTVHTFLSRMTDDPRHPTDPYLWGMRIGVRPHERLTFAVNRGSLFGGTDDPITAETVLKMLVGVVRSRFENQVLSLEGRYRLPTERVLPATVYLEWGADDAAGALNEQPARTAGVAFPALPGLPEVGVGAEYTRFSDYTGGHGSWYFHFLLRGNWARADRPLGHPLGGEGDEWAAYGQAELLGSRLRLEGRAFVRDRTARGFDGPMPDGGGNLFSPTRLESTGGRLDAALRLGRRADLTAGFAREEGEGWREQSLHAGVTVLF